MQKRCTALQASCGVGREVWRLCQASQRGEGFDEQMKKV